MNQKGFSKIILILIVIVLAGAAYWYWGDEIKLILQTRDWKTYHNNEFGFEFKYPQEFKTEEFNYELDEEQSNRGVELKSDELEIGLSINNTVYIGGAPTITISQEEIMLNNIKATKFITFGHQGIPYGTWVLTYNFEVNGNKYRLGTTKEGYFDGETEKRDTISKNTEALIEQIISTFKFDTY